MNPAVITMVATSARHTALSGPRGVVPRTTSAR